MTRAHPGLRFSTAATITATNAADFARAAGDENPLHVDPEAGRRSRFGGCIASAAQTSALLMGAVATHFSRSGPMLGLDFEFRYRRGVRVDQDVAIDWLVVRTRPSGTLGGLVVDLRGRLRDASGATAVGAKGRVLLESGAAG